MNGPSSSTEGTYRSWSSDADPWGLRRTRGYDHHVFVSYSRRDLELANELATSLISRGLRVFFADKCLGTGSGPWGLDAPGGWSAELQECLVRSCHFVGLLTAHYQATPWCDLEYLGFKNIRSANAGRKVILCKPDVRLPLPDMYAVCDALLNTIDGAVNAVAHSVQQGKLCPGDEVYPPRCFGDLPIEDVSGFWQFWDNSEQGNHIEPPRRVAVEIVRELMVRLRKGTSEAQLLQDLDQQDRRLAQIGPSAMPFAKELLRRGIAPETPPGSHHVPTDNELWRERPSEPTAAAPSKVPLPPVVPPEDEPVWTISWAGESRHTIEATCRACGYSEVFYPLDGDRPGPKCPHCGFDGTLRPRP